MQAAGRNHPRPGLALLEGTGERKTWSDTLSQSQWAKQGLKRAASSQSSPLGAKQRGWKTSAPAPAPSPHSTTNHWLQRTRSQHQKISTNQNRNQQRIYTKKPREKGKMRLLVNHGHLSIPRFPLEMLLKRFKISQGQKGPKRDSCKEATEVWKRESQRGGNPVSNRLPLELSYVMGPQLHSERGDACTVRTGARRHVQSSLPGTPQQLILHGPEGKVHNAPNEYGDEMPQNNSYQWKSHSEWDLYSPSSLPAPWYRQIRGLVSVDAGQSHRKDLQIIAIWESAINSCWLLALLVNKPHTSTQSLCVCVSLTLKYE